MADSAQQMACGQRKKYRYVSEHKPRVSCVPASVSLGVLRDTERHWTKLASTLWA